MTVKAEMTKLLAKTGSTLVIVADTTMVTIGSQASGLTGFMIWMIGLKAALTAFDSPHISPSGTATSVASTKPIATRSEERRVGKEGVRTCRSRWSPSH